MFRTFLREELWLIEATVRTAVFTAFFGAAIWLYSWMKDPVHAPELSRMLGVSLVVACAFFALGTIVNGFRWLTGNLDAEADGDQ